MATIPSVQLFRNSKIKTGRQAAIDALEAQKAFVADGGLILARYSNDGEDNNVKTLLGIVRNSGSGNAQLTIIDVEGTAENLQDAIKNISGETAFQEGKFISAITQTNGVVNVEFGGVAAANVSVADKGNKFTATTVEDTLLEIKNSLDNAIGVGGSVGTQITNAINALNSETVSGNGQVITAISQSNGIVSATASTLSASSVSFSSSGASFTADNVKDALDTLYTRSGDGSKVTLESAEGSEGSNVLKVYTIKQGGTKVGEINIPKDLVVQSGSVVKGTWDGNTFTEDVSGSGTSTGTALKLVIANQEAPVYINTLDLVKDHTGGNGISISDTNVISVVRDPDSDSFLTVGKNGVKLSGVQAAIDTASGQVNSIIDARLGTGVTSSSTATAQFAELQNKLGNGVTTTATVTAQLQALSGSSTSDTSDTISVIGARKYTDAKIANLNATKSGTSAYVDVTVAQANGIITSVTVANNDIASATALAAEANTRESADTELSNRLGTGVTTAEGKTVTEQLRALSGETSDGSTATSVNGAKAYAKDLVDNLDADVESTTESTTETTTTKAIRIKQTNGKIASITLGAFDCGVY